MTLFVAYPGVAHLAVQSGAYSWALAVLAALIGHAIASVVAAVSRIRWLLPPAGALLVLTSRYDGAWVIHLLPVALYCVLGWLFGRTLLSGGVPLISRFAQLEQGALNEELAIYTRRLTWVWTVLFGLMALISIVLAVLNDRELWSLFANGVSYVLVAGLFLAEIAYRRWRYRAYRHHSLGQLLRNIRRVEVYRQKPRG